MNFLIGHLIGDYLFQNDWMAQNKKLHWWPCFVHCLIYTSVIALLTRWSWWALVIVFVTHFIQDHTQIIRVWMKGMRQQKFMEPPMAPWSLIVVDNVWHLVVLYFLALVQ